MIQLKETIVVSASIEQAFDYAAEFQQIEDWDPGVVSAKRLKDEPAGIGSAYELVTVFKDRQSPMTYTITDFQRPGRLVLAGEGPNLSALDTIEFKTLGSGTEITYTADLAFRGLARFGTLLVRKDLEQLGKDAVAGLKEALG